ncbi:alanine--tRNA ligase [Siphonobacter sp. SORGH_AS_1065]|uniref:alanine--tRNA ligase n=1 Tax=Siphonobacter sp. SORGH_AS_1065 TaxID=3041795 RepID=UPI0027855082|nr:alanine--tRNA ligase [Siphonobacter sp. SORGH_AS_1065]MDQ1087498.1 alanyl-tRNA synthetase [Siphonobacter sp. SORGH_AS_1065]
MTSREIRQAFLDFFVSKGHLIVPSAPLVAKNDPTLMFNNSGMAQFKDYFLGNGTPPSRRIADTQKCLRVSGKHNDLEDVGFDTYHHTMFEMLGNWSFGDYFKKEALHWSWELLTEVYKLPKDRLYVSVFGGDEKDGVPFDQEAFDLWKEILGSEDRIILGNKKDNFWEMGEVGPCGPCSEIHVDLRDQDEVDAIPGKSLVNADHPQVVEIWNNVFMQFERKADGSLVPLPARHVDTGMGFERLCMAIQQKKSNYDTDVFTGTIDFIAKAAGKTYGEDKWADIAMRVISDHIRAIAFAIADGQLPSNVRAGYVIRRILRRAVRYGYTYLGFREPFLYSLIPLLADQFDGVFPELIAQKDFVAKVIQEEEAAFLRTLEKGLTLLDKILAQESESKVIEGSTVFELNDTFGFPVDLTALIAREQGFSIDEAGYQKALAEQKNRSRKDAATEKSDWVELQEGGKTVFLGYDQTEADSTLTKYRKVEAKGKTQYHVVLDQTPFYAESGGQVGDTGVLSWPNAELIVVDTKKENDLSIHVIEDEEFEEKLQAHGAKVRAKVDASRRKLIASNHTATHLMHSALQEVLGSHVAQKGSLVSPDLLRFDFSHFAKMTDEEIARVEQRVNEKIRENIALQEDRNVPIDEARQRGATALFGEKYGDFVRVITFDPNYSVELCGGTHVPATGEIGLFKITSESSSSTGVRRIEAITSEKAFELLEEQSSLLSQLKELLKTQDVLKSVQGLLEEKAALQKRVDSLEIEKLSSVREALVSKISEKNGIHFIAEQVEVPNADALKQLAYQLKDKVDNLFALLVAEVGGKPSLALMISENLVKERGLNAGQLVRELAKEVKGGGGGQPFFATAGGSDVSGLPKVIEKAATLI